MRIHQLVQQGSQLVIATHAPIVPAYPDAVLYRLDDVGITRVAYEDTEHVSLTRDFLENRAQYLRRLLGDAPPT